MMSTKYTTDRVPVEGIFAPALESDGIDELYARATEAVEQDPDWAASKAEDKEIAEKSFQAYLKDSADKVDAIKEGVDNNSDMLKAIVETAAVLKEDMEEVKINTDSTRVGELRDQLKAAKVQVSQARKELSSQKNQFNEMQSKSKKVIARLGKEISSFEKQLERVEKDKAKLEESGKVQRAIIKKLEVKAKDMKKTVKNATKKEAEKLISIREGLKERLSPNSFNKVKGMFPLSPSSKASKGKNSNKSGAQGLSARDLNSEIEATDAN